MFITNHGRQKIMFEFPFLCSISCPRKVSRPYFEVYKGYSKLLGYGVGGKPPETHCRNCTTHGLKAKEIKFCDTIMSIIGSTYENNPEGYFDIVSDAIFVTTLASRYNLLNMDPVMALVIIRMNTDGHERDTVMCTINDMYCSGYGD